MTSTERDARLHDGVHYPTGHLVGILRDARQAEQAAEVLRAAGLEDVVVFDGRQALQVIEDEEHKENPLRRWWERLSQELAGETDARRQDLEALRQGHAIVLVGAPQPAQRDQAEGILKVYDARAVQYFGNWTITDFRD
jgi:hypothetical protein